jgi:heptosyltransferase-2
MKVDGRVVHGTDACSVLLYGVFKGMGDLLAAAPVIAQELRNGRRVVVLVFPQVAVFATLLDFGQWKDRLELRVLTLGGWRNYWNLLRRVLGDLRPGIVLLSPHAPAPAASRKVPILLWVAARLFWRRARLVCAQDEPLSWLFDERFAVDRNLPLADREWSLYAQLEHLPPDVAPPDVSFVRMLFRLREQAPAYDLMIHPGASAENRKWPADNYAKLIRSLPSDLRIAVVGLPADLEIIRAVVDAGRPVDYLTGSLEQAIAHLGSTRVALTMDSGSMFFANMLGVRTVALFGPSAPQYVIPRASNILPIYVDAAPCQPCRSATCRFPTLYCMNAIAAATVADRLLAALKDAPVD